MRVFDGMPDGESAFAFTRTLRSVVDWQGQLVTMLDRTYLVGDAPVMLMWGEHDAIIPVEHAHRAHAALPSSRLELYPEAGHFPRHSDPLRFVSDLVAFIEETAPATHRPEEWRRRLQAGSAIVSVAG